MSSLQKAIENLHNIELINEKGYSMDVVLISDVERILEEMEINMIKEFENKSLVNSY